MSDENFDLFCTQCGARISAGTTFCPSCGAQVGGEPAPQANGYGRPAPNYYGPDRSGRLLVLSIICAITAVVLLGIAISVLTSIDQTIEQLKADPGWADFVKSVTDAGIDNPEGFIRDILNFVGISFLVAGIAAAVPAVCGFIKKGRVFGIIGCIIVTLFTATTLLGLIVGIIITVMYAGCKPAFK